MKRRGGILAAAVAAALVALAIVGLRCRSTDSAATAGDRPGVTAAPTAGGPAVPGDQAAAAAPPAWFVTPNAKPRRIAGTVTFDGAPVAGALVRLTSQLTTLGLAVPVDLRSAADGSFDFGVQPPGRFQVSASAPQRTAAYVWVNLADPTAKPASDALELRLRGCAAALVGTVFDSSGGPIAHARVRRDSVVGVETMDDGAYELCLPQGETMVQYDADGYGGVILTLSVLGRVQRNVVLIPEGIVVGRVIRADDARPVPGAQVGLWGTEWGQDRGAPGMAVSDAEGKFRVVGLTPGRYDVNASATGLAADAPVDVIVEAGKTSEEIVVRVAPRARLRGTIVAGGAPVAGANVHAVQKSPSRWSDSAVSQEDGGFELRSVPIGEVVFAVDEYELVSPTSFAVPAAGGEDVVLEVQKLGAIRGRVTRNGKPVEGAAVGAGQHQAVSEGDGTYELTGLSAGKYDIYAQSLEVGAFTYGAKITLARGEERNGVDLELNFGGRISGVVVDQDGKPVPGVVVRYVHTKTADVGESATGMDGRFSCAAMTGGGEYVPKVYPTVGAQTAFPTASGAPFPAVRVADGATEIDGVRLAIKLERLTIAGRVVDTVGSPVPDAKVRALATDGKQAPVFNTWLSLSSGVTDQDGNFAITELITGTYALQARSADGGEATVPAVAAPAKGIVITVERPGAIEGQLVGFEDPPTVYAAATGRNFKFNGGTIDGTGFRIPGLPAGRYMVTAQNTYEGGAQLVDVRAGEITKLTLTSGGRAAIEGLVLEWGTRKPVAGQHCHAVVRAGGQRGITNWDTTTAARSGEDGRIVIDPAPAGDVSVECFDQSSYRTSNPAADVTVPAGGRATVELFVVELVGDDNFGTVGLELDWRVTTPVISAVTAGGAAATAGLVAGDVITAIDGVSIAGLNGTGAMYLIMNHPIGTTVGITVARGGGGAGGQQKSVTLTVQTPTQR